MSVMLQLGTELELSFFVPKQKYLCTVFHLIEGGQGIQIVSHHYERSPAL